MSHTDVNNEPVQVLNLWWMAAIRGVLLLILSLMMFTWGRGVTLVAMIELMGVYWVVGGIFDVFAGILGRTEGSRIWTIVGAIVSVVAGFFVMGHPALTGMMAGFGLTYFMGGSAFIIGATQIFEGRKGKKSLGSLIMGIFTIVFGLVIVFNPVFTQQVLFFMLPFWALTAGVGAIFTSMHMASWEKKQAAA
ncbi:MAG: DUF308 domain-containing protein [Caldilineaceae bacterium]|nr:DUF308 domain-containing protein [Caldilineaceae bacterium]